MKKGLRSIIYSSFRLRPATCSRDPDLASTSAQIKDPSKNSLRPLLEHFPLSFIIGLTGSFLFQNWLCLPIALLTGWLIDGDHLFDFIYYAIRYYPNINYTLIRGGGYFKQNQKVFVLLHAWEWTSILMIGAMLFSSPILLIASIAHGAHLLQDQRIYHIRRFGYSIISRAKSKFTLTNFCREGHDA